MGNRAFSLIELLIALAVLAIVAAIIVPRFLNVRKQAALTVMQHNMAELNLMFEQWQALGGRIDTNNSAFQYWKNLFQQGDLSARAMIASALLDTLSREGRGATTEFVFDTTGPLGSNTIIFPVPPYDTSQHSSDPDGFVNRNTDSMRFYKVGDQLYPIIYNFTSSGPALQVDMQHPDPDGAASLDW